MPDLYHDIAQTNYVKFLSTGLSNLGLHRYFDQCFQESIDHYRMYPCWACVECLRGGMHTFGWGTKPARCSVCNTANIYQIATFQARASIVGKAFEHAFDLLMEQAFHIYLKPSPRANNPTHDLELPGRVAIELKGSPTEVANPDGSKTHLDRPGLERSDTQKKAFANATRFREARPQTPFYIVSNAVPQELVGYWDQHVSGIFNVTRVDRLQSLANQLLAL